MSIKKKEEVNFLKKTIFVPKNHINKTLSPYI